MTDRIPGTKFIVFAVICMIAAAWVASVSGNIAVDRIIPTILPFLDDAVSYEAELEEAEGLLVGDDVRIAGVDVGRVNSIRLEDGLAVVSFEVTDEVQPTTTWMVGARWRNVIGQRFLYLYPAAGGAPLPDGDRIPVSQSVPVANLAAFVNQITPLLEAIDPVSQNKLTTALNEVLVGRDQDIQNLVANLSELSATVAGEGPEIRRVIDNANQLLGEYNAREDQLTGFIDQLSSVSGTLAARNGELLDATVDIARVQEELGRLISANDDGLVDSLDDLEQVTDRIGDQRGSFEDAIASLRQGLASYMLSSRQGQWFNVRGVAVQVQEGGQVVSCTTESGTPCSFPNDPRATGGPDGSTPTSGPSAGTPTGVTLAPERLAAIDVVTRGPLEQLRATGAIPAGEGG